MLLFCVCVLLFVWLVGFGFLPSEIVDSPAANKLSSISGPLLLFFDFVSDSF